MFPLTGNCIFVPLVGSLPDLPPEAQRHGNNFQQQMLLAYRDNALRPTHKAVPSGHVLCRRDEKSDGSLPWRQQPFWLIFLTPSISSIPRTVFRITLSNIIYRMW